MWGRGRCPHPHIYRSSSRGGPFFSGVMFLFWSEKDLVGSDKWPVLNCWVSWLRNTGSLSTVVSNDQGGAIAAGDQLWGDTT
jgi:hypothetical protein